MTNEELNQAIDTAARHSVSYSMQFNRELSKAIADHLMVLLAEQLRRALEEPK